MKSVLLPIYGPLFIHSYGLCISLGVMLFSWCMLHDKQFICLGAAFYFSNIMLIGVIAALLGGKLLYMLECPSDLSLSSLFFFWQPGLSLFGSILGILCVIPWYLKYEKIPIIPFLDRVVVYIPLLQAVARIGCFFAGCCYGTPTISPWGVFYTDLQSMAPLYCFLHPVQLYSAFLLLLLFGFMYGILQKRCILPGSLTFIYFILMSIERFIIDFWRGDRIIIWNFLGLSSSQCIALIIFSGSVVSFLLSYLFFRQHVNFSEKGTR